MSTLSALNKTSLYRLIDVTQVARDKLPSFVKKIPLLYVPETKDVYEGKTSIFAHIAKPTVARREVPVQASNQSIATGGSSATQNPGGLEPGAWSFDTMGGFSDSYSSWANPNASTTDDQYFYSFLGGAPPAAAPGRPEPQTKQSFEGNKTGRNDDISSRMEAYKKQRESEFKAISRQ